METKKPESKPTNWIWWIVIAVLLAWTIFSFIPPTRPEASIPYTTFVDQVRQGNVTNVRIQGSEITGKLAKPLLWPPPTPGATPASPPVTPQSYSDFVTTFPDVVGDTSLLPLLESQKVVVDVAAPPNQLVAVLLTNVLPIVLLVVIMVWLGRRMMQGVGGGGSVLNFGRSQPRVQTGNQSNVTFKDVAGAEEAKSDLQEVVGFLRDPDKYHKLGARIPKGVLLIGPPGTGKTLLARAVAGEAHVPFFSISASEFVEMFVGVGASRVRDLFDRAKNNAPSIVFIDELDAVGRRRGAGLGTVNDEREQTLNQLLVEMDGFDERHEVIILAATNRPDVLDPALLRPGRFDRQVTVGLPDRPGREAILHIHTRGLPLAPDVDLKILAATTTGFSGADLANLANEAALIAAGHNHQQVDLADFEEAVDKVVLGGARSILLSDEDKRIVAYHEGGHAVVAWFVPQADPVLKVTIIPRGQALGVTEQLPGADRYNYGLQYLLARLTVMMAGRSSEEIALGEITTGAEQDLSEATRLARRMVTRWGMGSLGPVVLQGDEQQPFLGYELSQGREGSEATAARIDEDVRRLLDGGHEAARKILLRERQRLDALVAALLHEETVNQDHLTRILGPRPEPGPEAGTSPSTAPASATQAGA